jgi:hypothetical protein
MTRPGEVHVTKLAGAHLTHPWETGAFCAVLLLTPVLVFAAAVLLDHLIHGRNAS